MFKKVKRMGGELIAIFLKFPEPGKVKTRLGASVGDRKAASIYDRLVREVLAHLPAQTPLWVFFDPPGAQAEVERWLAPSLERFVEWSVHPQSPGDLGARLAGGFNKAFDAGYQKVAAIGGDCVDLRPSHFLSTWDLLGRKDVVFGPTTDQGYYLVGLSGRYLGVFDGVRWSSSETLQDSLDAAVRVGVSSELLEWTFTDIDTEADWRDVEQRIGRVGSRRNSPSA